MTGSVQIWILGRHGGLPLLEHSRRHQFLYQPIVDKLLPLDALGCGAEVSITAGQSLGRLGGREMGEIGVEARLFEETSVLREPTLIRIGGDDAVDGGGLGDLTLCGLAQTAQE